MLNISYLHLETLFTFLLYFQVAGSGRWGASIRRCDNEYLRLIDGAEIRHPTLGGRKGFGFYFYP